ncbi:MAG: S46 family peptidase [bacterium]|nr:S46 family peptidase [bacterium]
MKTVMGKIRTFAVPAFLILFLPCAADEGMWTFDNPPLKPLREKYGFDAGQEWLDHVRLASVRFMDGGSGSFVSPNGLVLTNHHVAVGQLQKMSTPEKDYVSAGFYAEKPEDESPCPDLEVNVLVSMEDVTGRVRSAVSDKMNAEQALKAREAAIAAIENECKEKTGLKPEVVPLYHGGEYWLYRYKKYTDIRLVMAPERMAAYYGGDSDNFTFPRYDLDMAFFRVYENGQPVRPEAWLKWNAAGAGEEELVFVSGHPGSTDRLYTLAQLEFQRDMQYPMTLRYIDRRIDILHEYMKTGPEQQRRGLIQLFGLENSKKALSGEYLGLQDPSLFVKKKAEEDALRKTVASRPEWKKAYAGAWKNIEKAVAKQRERARLNFYRRVIGSRLYGTANQIVFYAAETVKPESERLDGYHSSQLEELKFNLFSPAPVYKDLEEANLAGCLKLSLEELGPDDPFLKLVLDGRTPEAAAADLIRGTGLESVETRRRLIEGGRAAVDTCRDPLIVLARKLEPSAREGIQWRKKNVESVLSAGTEQVAQAVFAAYGKDRYPDATFTLRLSYGAVRGYPMNGTLAPYKTTLYGLYDRALSFDRKGDFEPPGRFWERRDSLDLATPVNFVSTCDIIGGNSGSPVLNRSGELVGLVFDGNIESLVGRFVYDDAKNRTVAVHSAYIIEALRRLYDASVLADEIEGK